MSRPLLILVLSASLLACAQAEEPVYFEDPNLKAVVETLMNSIFYHNTYNCSNAASSAFYTDATGEIAIAYSDIEGSWPGMGNIAADPLFVRRGQWRDPQNPLVPCDPSTAGVTWSTGDYHLLSDAGRWDAVALD